MQVKVNWLKRLKGLRLPKKLMQTISQQLAQDAVISNSLGQKMDVQNVQAAGIGVSTSETAAQGARDERRFQEGLNTSSVQGLSQAAFSQWRP